MSTFVWTGSRQEHQGKTGWTKPRHNLNKYKYKYKYKYINIMYKHNIFRVMSTEHNTRKGQRNGIVERSWRSDSERKPKYIWSLLLCFAEEKFFFINSNIYCFTCMRILRGFIVPHLVVYWRPLFRTIGYYDERLLNGKISVRFRGNSGLIFR